MITEKILLKFEKIFWFFQKYKNVQCSDCMKTLEHCKCEY